jgi:SAM-dependent methyltransferase
MQYLRNIFNFNSSRYRLHQEISRFASTIPPGSIVLDAGAGDQPYRLLFDHTIYESADFEKVDKGYASSTYVCDLAQIPTEDCRFDYIIFNQVMEHLPEPEKVLLELYRVLKPGGKVYYTGPLFYEEHEQPYDFFRYTQYGLKHLFTKAGFRIDKMEWLEGYLGTAAYQLNTLARYLPLSPKNIYRGISGYLLAPFFLVMKMFFTLSSLLLHRLEIKYKYTKKGFPKNYISILSKQA